MSNEAPLLEVRNLTKHFPVGHGKEVHGSREEGPEGRQQAPQRVQPQGHERRRGAHGGPDEPGLHDPHDGHPGRQLLRQQQAQGLSETI